MVADHQYVGCIQIDFDAQENFINQKEKKKNIKKTDHQYFNCIQIDLDELLKFYIWLNLFPTSSSDGCDKCEVCQYEGDASKCDARS